MPSLADGVSGGKVLFEQGAQGAISDALVHVGDKRDTEEEGLLCLFAPPPSNLVLQRHDSWFI